MTDESITRSEEVKGGQGLRESASLLYFRGSFMENKSEISVYLPISSTCEDFLTKADWILPQLDFMGMIKEALLRQKKSFSSKHYFRHEQLISNIIHLLLLNVQYHWPTLCRLSLPFIELMCAAGSGSATQLNFDQSRVKHQRSVCTAGDSSSEKADRPPRHEPICHWRGSIPARG